MSSSPTSSRKTFASQIRENEVQLVINFIGSIKGKRILEIGGGNGLQASIFEKHGFDVESIDICPHEPNSSYFTVAQYDGHHIPFDDNYFDIVFSSNVLEHIAHIDDFEKEIHRVLTPNGKAIHVLPTPAWRIWTSLTHPLRVINRLNGILFGSEPTRTGKAKNSVKSSWRYVIWPNRHGEKGNSFTEIYWFSSYSWSRHFRKNGWNIEQISSTHLFYTGQLTLGGILSIPVRRILSRFLGSATKVYVLNTLTK